MGLASFNRMRRQRAPVEAIEAQRFKDHNAMRNDARNAKVDVHRENREKVAEIREEEKAAMARIGELNVEGLDKNDEPMRREHAAEIVGRNKEGVQEPKDPVQLVHERTPHGTANEELVSQMLVSGPGPDQGTLQAAREEAGVRDPDAARRERGPLSERDPEQQDTLRAKRRAERDQRRETRDARTPRTRSEAVEDASDALGERAAVEIPTNWRDLPWPKKRSLAAKVANDKVNTQPQAEAAIEAELRRRG